MKSEVDKLKSEVDKLKSEIASVREEISNFHGNENREEMLLLLMKQEEGLMKREEGLMDDLQKLKSDLQKLQSVVYVCRDAGGVECRLVPYNKRISDLLIHG